MANQELFMEIKNPLSFLKKSTLKRTFQHRIVESSYIKLLYTIK